MDDATGFFILMSLFVLGVCSVAGYLMLARVGRGAFGWALGFLLGPLGLVLAWVIRDNALRDQVDEYRGQVRSAQKSSGGIFDVTSGVIIGGVVLLVLGFVLYLTG